MKKMILTVLVLSLCACGHPPHYKNAVNSWLGAPMEELFDAWGYPDDTEALKNGERSYRWTEYKVFELPPGPDGEDESIIDICHTIIITDPDGRVAHTDTSVDCWMFSTPPTRPKITTLSEKQQESQEKRK